jgi:hypothetical protein
MICTAYGGFVLCILWSVDVEYQYIDVYCTLTTVQ